MLFITNPRLRKLEAFMQEVPHFPPRGAKVDFDSLEDEILLFEIENVIVNFKPPNENLNIGKENTMKFRATPRNDRLTALRAACLHIFRHLAQILLEIRRYSCVGFIQADEKSDGAIHTQPLCGVASETKSIAVPF